MPRAALPGADPSSLSRLVHLLRPSLSCRRASPSHEPARSAASHGASPTPSPPSSSHATSVHARHAGDAPHSSQLPSQPPAALSSPSVPSDAMPHSLISISSPPLPFPPSLSHSLTTSCCRLSLTATCISRGLPHCTARDRSSCSAARWQRRDASPHDVADAARTTSHPTRSTSVDGGISPEIASPCSEHRAHLRRLKHNVYEIPSPCSEHRAQANQTAQVREETAACISARSGGPAHHHHHHKDRSFLRVHLGVRTATLRGVSALLMPSWVVTLLHCGCSGKCGRIPAPQRTARHPLDIRIRKCEPSASNMRSERITFVPSVTTSFISCRVA